MGHLVPSSTNPPAVRRAVTSLASRSAPCAGSETARKNLTPGAKPTLVCDSGNENVNDLVDEFIKSRTLDRIRAQVDVSYSNSMIEAWWRSLKHRWLFVNPLPSLGGFRTLVAFFVEQHNKVMPHSAFRGQTPDEMYFGTGAAVPTDLAAARLAARQARVARNRQLHCSACQPHDAPLAVEAALPVVSGAVAVANT